MVSSVPNSARLFRFDRREHPLRQRLLPAIQQGVVSLEVRPATVVEHLESLLLRDPPDVLHVVCHGTDAGDERALSFEDRYGQRTPVSAARLEEILAKLKGRRPSLLVLEACDSRSIGEALADAGGYVVAMEGDADPAAGTRFFSAFYQALAAGRCVHEAFAGARRALELLSALAVDTPVLLGSSEAIDKRLQRLPDVAPRGISRETIDECVSRSAAHGEAKTELRGRDEWLARLSKAVAAARRGGPVLVRGPAGVGKTALLRRWLDSQHELGWFGFSRVFTWSFDATQEGRGVGDIHAFLEEALYFFGDPVHEREWRDPTPKAYLRGLRLGRLIRDEPALLVLDAVPLLPRGSGASAELDSLLHPALAALLRECKGGAAACVLAVRDAGLVATQGCAPRDLGGLDDVAGAELLWRAGLVDTASELRGLSASLRGEPLALELCARSYATAADAREALANAAVPTDTGPLARLLAALCARMDAGSRDILDALALLGGRLAVDEHVIRDEGEGERDGDAEATRCALLRPLVRAGIVHVDRGSLVAEFSHPALLDAALRLLRGRSHDAPLLDRAAEGLEPANDLADVRRLAAVVALASRVGEHTRARSIYMDKICRAEPSGPEQSLVARTLGAIAEDLRILAGFFAVDDAGARLWDRLDAGGEDVAAAFVFHRLALALRHLGRVDEAVKPMQCALRGYRALDERERVATCANDLAELQLARGELEAALTAATDAVAASEASGEETTFYLTRATLGHVQHFLGELEVAEESFVEVEERIDATDAPVLFSRPGFQRWTFLLDVIERRWRAECVVDIDALEKLRTRLEAASASHGKSSIAPVSRALDALAGGRLATLELEIALARGEDKNGMKDVRLAAMRKLGVAVSTFRSQHHRWMLPQALCARARMRRLLDDPVNASLDLDEAEDLARGQHLRLDVVACFLERASLHASMGEVEEGHERLREARRDLETIERCHRLAEAAEFVEAALARAATQPKRFVREPEEPAR